MTTRILTNLYRLSHASVAGFPVEVAQYRGMPSSLREALHLYRELGTYDYVLINCAPADLLVVALLKALRPGCRGRLVSQDTVLPIPKHDTIGRRLRLWLKVFLFRQVDLFIEYFRETGGYESWYGIPKNKFRYVPFKINRYEKVLATTTTDEGYIFCGGNTRRDFATLIGAVRDTPWPIRIVTMAEETIRGHGSFLDESRLPGNVEVVRHDGGDSFIDHIARSRLVVLPIAKDNISASGIGVYLASMALGKCVIISSGPAVNGVIPEGSAIVVPPEDPAALREAISKAFADAELRGSVAARARTYALGLEGDDRLAGSVMATLAEDHASRRQSAVI